MCLLLCLCVCVCVCVQQYVVTHPDRARYSFSRAASIQQMASRHSLNREQELAVTNVVERGKNTLLQAPPGTGKSACLLEAAIRVLTKDPSAKVLVCAYNVEIASDMTSDLTRRSEEALVDKDRWTCSTLHALCNTYVGPAQDDVTMQRSLQGASGRPIVCPEWTHAFVDEAQDLTPALVTVLRVCFPNPERVVWLLAGDRDQLIYDYGDAPATGELMTDPNRVFPDGAPRQEWTTVALRTTYRLTPPMTRLVDAHFGIRLVSSREGVECDPVYVHGATKTNLPEAVSAVVRKETGSGGVASREVTLLVANKAGNFQLLSVANRLSQETGVQLYVHGVDGSDDDVRDGKLKVGTFHSSKGTQTRCCLFVVPPTCKRNSTFVGLTRAFERLHVFLIKDCFDAAFVGTLLQLVGGEGAPTVVCDAEAIKLLRKGASSAASTTKGEEQESLTSYACTQCNLDVRRRWGEMRHLVNISEVMHESDDHEARRVLARASGLCEDVGHVYCKAILMEFEFGKRGRVRAVDDMLFPVRLNTKRVADAVMQGLQSRVVSPFATDDTLLAKDLRDLVAEAYDRRRRAEEADADDKAEEDWLLLASATFAWNGYHHRMRQLLPVRAWMDVEAYSRGRRGMTSVADEVDAYDVVVHKSTSDGVLVHLRCHASSPTTCFHMSWSRDDATSSKNDAAQRAMLHSSGRCCLVCLQTGDVRDVNKVVTNGGKASSASCLDMQYGAPSKP